MTANARILTNKLDDTFKVPNALLRLHPSAAVLKGVGLAAASATKQQVYVLQNGKLKAVPVTFGISDGQYTAVTSGDLQTGQQLVVRFSTGATSPTTVTSPTAPSGTRRTPGL
jgi:HlyD family secretion protein